MILITLSQSDGIQKKEKKVTKSTSQSYTSLVKDIPLKISINELHTVCHPRLLTTHNIKQFRKSCFEDSSPHTTNYSFNERTMVKLKVFFNTLYHWIVAYDCFHIFSFQDFFYLFSFFS